MFVYGSCPRAVGLVYLLIFSMRVVLQREFWSGKEIGELVVEEVFRWNTLRVVALLDERHVRDECHGCTGVCASGDWSDERRNLKNGCMQRVDMQLSKTEIPRLELQLQLKDGKSPPPFWVWKVNPVVWLFEACI